MVKGKQVVFTAPGQVVMEEREINYPGTGQVLVRSLFTLVSTGTELTALMGNFPLSSVWARYVRYPFSPGYDNVGEVIALGEGIEGLEVGEKIFCWAPHGQFALVDSKRVYKVSEDVPLQEVTFAALGQIALNGVRLGEIALGESVVIIGLGPVGQLALQFVRLSGSFPIIAVDLSEKRLEIARSHGADFTLGSRGENSEEEIRHLTRGRMADVVFEVTGNQKVIPWALRLLKRRGKLVILGSPRGKVEVDFHDEAHTLGLRIIGAHNSMHTPYETPYNQWTLERDLELFLDLLRSGRVRVKDLISHVFPWWEAPKAYQLLLEDRTKTMGVLFDWTTPEP
jgi:2-desacetyl-2-hydroxyethyl bacteriochlorophyllide A dehydrogenase